MWQFTKGCVIIHCTGRNLSRFLDALRMAGVGVEHVRSRTDGGMLLTLRARDFRRIRPIVRACGCHVHIVSRRGAPFLLWRVWRRPVLLFGTLAAAALLLVASTRIVHIDIAGCKRLPEALVLRALSEQGIDRFGPYPERSLADIAAMMRLYDARIAWVSLGLTGNCLRVTVTEMEPGVSTVDAATPCDVVAVKDGVLRTLDVYEGHSAFRIGDRVKAGDVVIAGEFFPETNEVVETPLRVHARGNVVAEVSYFSEYAAEPTEMALQESGNSVPYRRITLWGRTLSQTEPPYADYELCRMVTRPFGESLLPIRVTEGECRELTLRERRRTRAEQTELALTEAERLSYLKIPPDAYIVDKLTRTRVVDDVVIGVVCVLTQETIGLARELEG